MLRWYGIVIGARVRNQNPAISFLTFDDEHHRFAFLDLSVIDLAGTEPETTSWTGVDCKANSIEPNWCVYHGLTISMCYADPDGNQMEFQLDAFDSVRPASNGVILPTRFLVRTP